VAHADMRVGKIRQYCKLQDEGQSLMRAATRAVHEPAQFVSARLSSYPETGAPHCGSGGAKGYNPRIWWKRCTLRSRPKLMMG